MSHVSPSKMPRIGKRKELRALLIGAIGGERDMLVLRYRGKGQEVQRSVRHNKKNFISSLAKEAKTASSFISCV